MIQLACIFDFGLCFVVGGLVLAATGKTFHWCFKKNCSDHQH